MEGDKKKEEMSSQKEISIHSLRMEGDKLDVDHNGKLDYFNPLPPHGGRHLQTDGLIFPKTFQSTPSAWRETNIDNVGYLRYRLISIHSLRMEGDTFRLTD